MSNYPADDFDKTVNLRNLSVDDLDRTTRFSYTKREVTDGLRLTIFDGMNAPELFDLSSYRKDLITFGRNPDNDIVLSSKIVSKHHGRIVRVLNHWKIEDLNSTNGLLYNNTEIISKELSDGDFIRIDDGTETIKEGVLFIFSADEGAVWETLPLRGRSEVLIGRDASSTIRFDHISVSKHHARIVSENGQWFLQDLGSTNGVLINGIRISGKVKLNEKDIITITNSKLIFTSEEISYTSYKKGISVDASEVVIERKNGRKRFITCNHVSLGVHPGELVAIIGGSGAGKSTILNAMCGYLPPSEGHVFINGNDLYRNFDSLKKLVGYVPQQDIVFNDLTLYDMLNYAAQLRLPNDTSKDEREIAINKAIETVELTEKKDSLIRSLSGGQKKRASIAVELLSDPNLLYLDEPASGLDPGTERSLMQSLRQMANSGKTVILVTHSTLQLKICDKIVFMGKGGNLCFYGSYDDALAFFGVDDIVDVYNMITDEPERWSGKYREQAETNGKTRGGNEISKGRKDNGFKQLAILSARYFKLILNDRQRLLLLLLQAPLLAALIALVADGEQFEQFEMTQSLLFALSCCGFWIGMLNSIQEICKERTILKREYMTGLSLTSYILSKVLVLGLMCLIQSIMVMGVFALLVGLPDSHLFMPPFLEMLLTTFLTALAASAMGLFVSSLFSNADRAMTVAPVLLLPQILFSGLIFKLEGAAESVSWITVCRWSMEAYGTTADLNSLPLKLQQKGIPIEHEVDEFFEFTKGHLAKDWLILVAFTLIVLVIARIVLTKVKKEK